MLQSCGIIQTNCSIQTPRQGSFEHPAILQVLMTPFCHGLRGSEYPGKFLDEYCPMPKTLLAFAVTVVSSMCSLPRLLAK
jgi:hypothetical protein